MNINQIKYNNMIKKLKLLEEQKKKLEFKINILKEKIDEFETIHLFDKIDKIDKIEKDDNKLR